MSLGPHMRVLMARAFPDADALRAASLLIEQYGTGAAQLAADQAREFARESNDKDAVAWSRVALAALELLRPPGPEDTVN